MRNYLFTFWLKPKHRYVFMVTRDYFLFRASKSSNQYVSYDVIGTSQFSCTVLFLLLVSFNFCHAKVHASQFQRYLSSTMYKYLDMYFLYSSIIGRVMYIFILSIIIYELASFSSGRAVTVNNTCT